MDLYYYTDSGICFLIFYIFVTNPTVRTVEPGLKAQHALQVKA